MVNSFDIFDTLIGRKCFLPYVIFEEVEKISFFHNFKKIRTLAEQQVFPPTFDTIYEQFQQIANCNVDKLKALEFERELANVFPIRKNIDKVEDGDILVSDTYFNIAQLTELLTSVGFTKKVKIFNSYDGKHNGWIWPEIQKKHKINIHTGDDDISPGKFLIKTNPFDAKMGMLEQKINTHHAELARIMRCLRLMNPYYGNKGFYWDYQAQINFPLLVAASYVLNKICKNRYKKILFATRDCNHWQRVYQKLFPEEVIKLHTSRKLIKSNNSGYKDYVFSLYGQDAIIVDLNSRGSYKEFIISTGLPFNFFTLHTSRQFSCLEKTQYFTKSDPIPNVLNTIMVGEQLEILNYDVVGSMVDYVNGQVIRSKVEYDCDIVKAGHECIQLGLDMISPINMNPIYNFGEIILTQLIERIKTLPPLQSIINFELNHL